MDEIALRTLASELADDCRVANHALAMAEDRIAMGNAPGYEATAHHLCRAYNVIEQMATRIARAFENNIEDEQGWHAELIRRMSVAVTGIRPAFFPLEIRQSLHDLRGFRHVFVHAYDLELDPAKLTLLLNDARKVIPRLPTLCRAFIDSAVTQYGFPPLSWEGDEMQSAET